MVKIAFVTANYAYPDVIGGAEIFSYMLAKKIARLGYDIHFIARRRSNHYLKMYEDCIRFHPFSSIDVFGIRTALSWAHIYRKLLKIKPDICFSTMFYGSLPCYAYSLTLSKPCVVRFGGPDIARIFLFKKGSFYKLRKSSSDVIASATLATTFDLMRLNVFFVAINKTIYKYLLNLGVPEEHVYLIYNPVDDIFFNVKPDMESNNIVFVGRITYQKGIDLLVEAFSNINMSIPNTKLIIVGDGDERARIEKMIARLGLSTKIDIVGFVPNYNVPEYLAKASLFVLPSRFEGTSNALLQAMAAGLPIVATNVGGIPDVIDDGLNGVLVPPENVKALAQSMEYLIVNKEVAKKLGENARRKAFRFKMDNIVEQYIKMFKKLAHQPS